MLTTVEQRGKRVGEEAVNILVGHIEGIIPQNKVERRVVRTRLVLRGTTR
jgi:LacI family transcriptional regulator/LacI family repressor for deo operon, udp, cdd, tsx, nupC, and nupG